MWSVFQKEKNVSFTRNYILYLRTRLSSKIFVFSIPKIQYKGFVRILFFYDDNLARTCDPTWRWRDPVHVTPIDPPNVSRDIYRNPFSQITQSRFFPYFVACRSHWFSPRENENVFLETEGEKEKYRVVEDRRITKGLKLANGFSSSCTLRVQERASLRPWMEGNGRKVFSIDGWNWRIVPIGRKCKAVFAG